jgi:hypothetical protein
MTVADTIYELAVADDVYIRNGSGSIIGMQTFNVQRFTIQYKYTIMHCRCRLNYQMGSVGMPLTGLIPPQLCACPKPGFPTSYVMVYLMLNKLR